MNEELNRIRNARQFYRTQMEIMVSRPVLTGVAEEFNAAFENTEPDLRRGRQRGGRDTGSVSELLDVFVVGRIRSRRRLSPITSARPTPSTTLRARRAASRDAQTYLTGRLADYEALILASNERLLAYQMENNLADAEEDITELSSRMNALSKAKAETTTERVMLEAAVASHAAQLSRRDYVELSNELDSLLITEYSKEHATAVAELARVSAQYGEKYPARVAAQAMVDRLEQELRSQVEEALSTERVRLETFGKKEQDLQTAIDEAKRQLLERQGLKSEYEKLRLEVERTRKFHEELSDRDHELELASQTQLNNVRIVETALAPSSPVSPNILLNILIALFSGTMGGVALAFVKYHMDDRLGSPAEIEAFLRIGYLGMVPEVDGEPATRERALHSHQNPRSAVAESVRAIRTLVELKSASEGPRRRLLLTSSAAAEGKTETTVRLAIAYADLGRRVVVVDADLRRARMHKLFGLQRGPGLTELSRGDATIEQAVVDTGVPNVSLLPAGAALSVPMSCWPPMTSARCWIR